MTSKRKILVTSALPYANGSIHLGHMVEHIQTDIWVRFQKMRGHVCHYVCADDAHGTPVMLAAEKHGIAPEELIKRVHAEHLSDFLGFYINYDNYYSTHSDENREFSSQIYSTLKRKNLIAIRTIEQLFDPEKNMFLPDRFIKGDCPKCSAKDQYGDNCEVCGATYNATEMKHPYSTVSGAIPVLKNSEHYFFCLSNCEGFLRDWIANASQSDIGVADFDGYLQPESAHKMQEWLKGGLHDWDISRDVPYFGFEIPDAPGKYFYVWLDAPVGYMASFKNLCSRNKDIDFDSYFINENHDTELYHFIGKDILYFHALFWPAMLKYSDYRTPSGIFAHGFLTVDGQKMSKSRGTFITARSYIDSGLNPEWLRYYFAAKLNSKIEDIDLSFDDFIARINSDLIGKFINIASRSAGFISKRFNGRLASSIVDNSLLETLQNAANKLADLYEQREYSHVLREVMNMSDMVNVYVDANKPWELAKDDSKTSFLHEICSVLINAFRLLCIYLKPVLPKLVEQVESFLNVPSLLWSDADSILLDHTINPYFHLMQRIEKEQIRLLLETNKQVR